MGSDVFDYGDIRQRLFFVIADDGVICYKQQNRWVCVCHNEAHSPNNMIPSKISETVNHASSYYFCKHGKMHRENDLPTILSLIANNQGKVISKIFAWYHNGFPYRETGPASYKINEDGELFIERYFYKSDGFTRETNFEEYKLRYEFLWLKPYQYKHDKRYEEFEMEWTGEKFKTEQEAQKRLKEIQNIL